MTETHHVRPPRPPPPRRVALKFTSREEQNKAIDLFHSDPALRGIHRDYLGGFQIIVEEDWVPYLRSLKLYFEVREKLEVEPGWTGIRQQLKAELRRKKGENL